MTGVAPVLVERHGASLLVHAEPAGGTQRHQPRVLRPRSVTLSSAPDSDPDMWALVITGAGDQAFCAGADLKAISRGESIMSDDPARRQLRFAQYVAHPISKPTIAAVNGFALGGGTEITLASDLAVAANSAQFGLPEVTRGILAGAGGAFRLPRRSRGRWPWRRCSPASRSVRGARSNSGS